MDTDRNLLVAVLAHQRRLIDQDQFVHACVLWSRSANRPLADVLVELGWLTPEAWTELEGRLQAGSPATVLDALDLPAGHAPESRQVSTVGGPSALTPPPPPGSRPTPTAADPRPATGSLPSPPSAGRHLLLGEIGRGGMGAVFKGRDSELGRELAVKVLLEEHRGEPELTRRFLEEAQIHGQLQHPGVVPVHELGRLADGRPYFTMKLVKGRTLSDLLRERRDPRDDLPRFLTIFEHVCQTLAHAHARRVIHRDLKPSNVMVGAFGEVQVMDWGMAKVLPPAGAGETDPGRPAPGEATVIRTARAGAPAEASQAGSVMGTPSYMPPEQARGEVGRIDERADVFGLGGILCVILTGQPPYSGRDVGELQAQARRGDVAEACARLDGCGADAELVRLCKDCLAPRPEDRPRDAGAVARRVTGFQEGMRERLRQAELAKAAAEARTREERKRRRVATALAAAVLALVSAAAGGGIWLQRQRAELRQSVEASLQIAEGLRQQARWPSAREVLGEADRRLGGAGPEDLRRRVGQARADLELVAWLDGIRQRRATISEGKFDNRTAERGYEAVFRDAGLGEQGEDPEQVAARVRGSAVREALVAALDDWAVACDRDAGRRAWLLEVARRADPDEWRDRFRRPEAWKDRRALEELAAGAKVAELSAPVLAALGEALMRAGGDAVPLLRAAQDRYPDDFWINLDLGNALLDARRPEEAVGYHRVACSARPGSVAALNNLGNALATSGRFGEAIALYRKTLALDPAYFYLHNNLGLALNSQRRWDEAIPHFRKALEIDPTYSAACNNLGIALSHTGRLDEAIDHHRKALDLDPKNARAYVNLGIGLELRGQPDEAGGAYHKALALDPRLAPAHNNLGHLLYSRHRTDEAIAHYRKALDLDPRFPEAHNNLGFVLAVDKGQPEEAVLHYRRAIELDPLYAFPHNNLGNLLKDRGRLAEATAEFETAIRLDAKYAFPRNGLGNVLQDKGQVDDAIREYRTAIDLDPKNAFPHNNLGNALKAKGDLDAAVREYKAAIELDPQFAKPHNNLAIVLVERGLLDEAIEHCRKAIALDPAFTNPHYVLGGALLKQGRFAEARDATRRCLDLFPAGPPLRRDAQAQLQRCEQLLALEKRLPALLKGEAEPAGADECLALARFCQYEKSLFTASARFYEAAFRLNAELADDLARQYRYDAACAAAMAGCGRGKDADKLDDKERARLRGQALAWLNADLRAWTQRAAGNDPKDRELVRKTLRHWQADTDLAGVRNPDALMKLPGDERDGWHTLWAGVAAVLKKVEGTN